MNTLTTWGTPKRRKVSIMPAEYALPAARRGMEIPR